MPNNPKPENTDEHTAKASLFYTSLKQIQNAEEKIKEYKELIALQEWIKSKAEGIINILTGKITISDIAPMMPKTWENNPELSSRYDNLIQTIQNNPQWWIEWKDKIELQDEGINFKELHLILDLDDLPEIKNWDDGKKEGIMKYIPEIADFRGIKSFISHAGNENRKLLENFLGLNNGLYWSSTEFPGDKTKAYKMGFADYANSDTVDSKKNDGRIRTIQRY
ncbi:MAG: hypothetical protein WC850_01590 [Candidatus Gracilibacteria bacterium]